MVTRAPTSRSFKTRISRFTDLGEFGKLSAVKFIPHISASLKLLGTVVVSFVSSVCMAHDMADRLSTWFSNIEMVGDSAAEFRVVDWNRKFLVLRSREGKDIEDRQVPPGGKFRVDVGDEMAVRRSGFVLYIGARNGSADLLNLPESFGGQKFLLGISEGTNKWFVAPTLGQAYEVASSNVFEFTLPFVGRWKEESDWWDYCEIEKQGRNVEKDRLAARKLFEDVSRRLADMDLSSDDRASVSIVRVVKDRKQPTDEVRKRAAERAVASAVEAGWTPEQISNLVGRVRTVDVRYRIAAEYVWQDGRPVVIGASKAVSQDRSVYAYTFARDGALTGCFRRSVCGCSYDEIRIYDSAGNVSAAGYDVVGKPLLRREGERLVAVRDESARKAFVESEMRRFARLLSVGVL